MKELGRLGSFPLGGAYSRPDRDAWISLTKHRQPLAYFTTFAPSGMENPSFAGLGIDFHESLVEKGLCILGIVLGADDLEFARIATRHGETWRWRNASR